MTARLLLLSDTHLPTRARDLPPSLWADIDDADIVVHAGDWVALSLLDEIRTRARLLVAVFGNNDPPEIRARLPLVARVTVEGVRIAVVHETGPARGREGRADEQFPETDVLVFGHSHIPWDTCSPNGIRLINPGSPTDRRRQPECTWMKAEVHEGALTRLELVLRPRP